jgi:NAD(P)H-hydrate repair Nnr-like enzyme with NAD(P)H-hydrate epimerase domain
LVLARLLFLNNYNVHVFVVPFSPKSSKDFDLNLEKLHKINFPVEIFDVKNLPNIKPDGVIIDGIFGTGLSRPADGIAKQTIEFINITEAKKFSIDIPSGLYADKSNNPTDPLIILLGRVVL